MWKSSIYMHIYIYICKHTYIHTYIHAYLHTYMHTDRQTNKQTDRQTYVYIYIFSNWLRTTKSYCNIFGSKHLYIYTHVCVFDTYQQLSMAVFYHSPWKGMNLRQESTLCQLGRMPPVNLVKPDKTQRTPANPANLGKPWQTRQTWQTMREVVS